MTTDINTEPSGPRTRVLAMATWSFTILFAVWLMLGILGLKIKQDAGLILGDAAAGLSAAEAKAMTDSRFEWLLAAAILAGSLPRLNFGIWADRYGGRTMMIAVLLIAAVPCFLLSLVENYSQLLLCAVGFGLAGNSFTVGISWVSVWYPEKSKGTALGVFGAGNVGAAGTKLLLVFVPTVLAAGPMLGGIFPGGWRTIPVFYAILLVLTALAVYLVVPKTERRPGRSRLMSDMMKPLSQLRVWRFSLYYVVVFGAYVAISGWLPGYYVGTYGIELKTAALFTAIYIFPASLLRPLGGWLSDRYGARVVTYGVFIAMIAATIPLSLPSSILSLDVYAFTALIAVVGVAMGIGKASVYKYIPQYYPNDVGAVGGLVGMIGALGGFLLPPLFGTIGRGTGSPQAAFWVLMVLTLVSLVWLHLIVTRKKKRAKPQEAANENAGMARVASMS